MMQQLYYIKQYSNWSEIFITCCKPCITLLRKIILAIIQFYMDIYTIQNCNYSEYMIIILMILTFSQLQFQILLQFDAQ